MSADLSELDLGFAVSLGALREVLRDLNVGGRRWWISSDPYDAPEMGYVTIAHGTKDAYDRLNTLHFRVPIIRDEYAAGRTERLILMIDPSTATAEEPDYRLRSGSVVNDTVEDLYSFISPIQAALIGRLRANN